MPCENGNWGPFQTSLFSCAEPNANELEQRILLIYIRFGGAWEKRRLKRALDLQKQTSIIASLKQK